MRTISAIALALLLSACGGGETSDEKVSDPISSVSPADDLNSDFSSITPSSSTPSTFCGITSAGSRLVGVVSKVHDGDTITVNGHSIRLDSIDAPELKQEYGIQSRDNLSNLVKDQSVTVTYAKKDKYGRIVGTVFKNDCTQVNLRQVETGSAWYYAAYKCEISAASRMNYANAEYAARSSDIGLWESDAIAPWVYRNGVEAKVPASCPNDFPAWDRVATPPANKVPVVITEPACKPEIWVDGYTRKNGTTVRGYWRNNPYC